MSLFYRVLSCLVLGIFSDTTQTYTQNTRAHTSHTSGRHGERETGKTAATGFSGGTTHRAGGKGGLVFWELDNGEWGMGNEDRRMGAGAREEGGRTEPSFPKKRSQRRKGEASCCCCCRCRSHYYLPFVAVVVSFDRVREGSDFRWAGLDRSVAGQLQLRVRLGFTFFFFLLLLCMELNWDWISPSHLSSCIAHVKSWVAGISPFTTVDTDRLGIGLECVPRGWFGHV
ncbi:hypothetical protein V8F20_001081 [Naviculisporaceae sp. PSN 640]